MPNTDITDNICIVTINCRESVMDCMKTICDELLKKEIKIHYSSVVNFTKYSRGVMVAIEENNLFGCIGAISCVKDEAKITFCTINSSNTIVKIKITDSNVYDMLCPFEDKIRLIYENSNEVCVIFESDIKHGLLARIEDMSI